MKQVPHSHHPGDPGLSCSWLDHYIVIDTHCSLYTAPMPVSACVTFDEYISMLN